VVRSLSRLAAGLILAAGACGPFPAFSEQGIEANSESALRVCMERAAMSGPTQCVIDESVVTRTSGAAALSAGTVMSVTLPVGVVLDLVLKFENPSGCLVWNHSGTEPSVPVDVLRINAPATVAANSRIQVIDACVREQRAGVPGGSLGTSVTGIALRGAGSGNVRLAYNGIFRNELRSVGVGTAAQTGGAFLTAGVPGMEGNVGTDETLHNLLSLDQFQAVSAQVAAEVYADPIYGSDSTGDGSYDKPYFSFWALKVNCLLIPNSKCVVKGRDRVFTHTLLTLTYTGAAGTRPLLVGETVTFTTPAGTARVLSVESNFAAVTWLSGSDPRVGGVTTFSAGGGESQGTVTAVRDSINGLPSRVIAAADINIGTEIITSTGHSYATGDGPFNWNNQTTIPTTVPVMTESSAIFVCAVSGATFRIGTSAACSTRPTCCPRTACSPPPSRSCACGTRVRARRCAVSDDAANPPTHAATMTTRTSSGRRLRTSPRRRRAS
jgi:hypothetical protein